MTGSGGGAEEVSTARMKCAKFGELAPISMSHKVEGTVYKASAQSLPGYWFMVVKHD